MLKNLVEFKVSDRVKRRHGVSPLAQFKTEIGTIIRLGVSQNKDFFKNETSENPQILQVFWDGVKDFKPSTGFIRADMVVPDYTEEFDLENIPRNSNPSGPIQQKEISDKERISTNEEKLLVTVKHSRPFDKKEFTAPPKITVLTDMASSFPEEGKPVSRKKSTTKTTRKGKENNNGSN